LEFLFDLFGFFEKRATISMHGIDLDELGQALNTASMLLELKKSITTEIQALHIRWVHLEDLVSDADDALPILQLVLADY
jgi:hypothetical protein